MKNYIHKEFPKTVGRRDFWKQIKRTVNGQEVSEKDISRIVTQVSQNLCLRKSDHLLDLGCGNGALASNFFSEVGYYTGVDFSEYLLDVAKEFFNPEGVKYIDSSVESFVNNCDNPSEYTKILIYGVMSYFGREGFIQILTKIKQDFINAKCIFIGNIPNELKAEEFYGNRGVLEYDVGDMNSAIGTWWTPEGLLRCCNEIGFKAELFYMPTCFYGAKYRYDIRLTR